MRGTAVTAAILLRGSGYPSRVPRKDSEFTTVLKWTGLVLGVSGTVATAFGKWPLAPVLLIANCAVWAAVGRAWREPTVWLTNTFAGLVALIVLIVKLAFR